MLITPAKGQDLTELLEITKTSITIAESIHTNGSTHNDASLTDIHMFATTGGEPTILWLLGGWTYTRFDHVSV